MLNLYKLPKITFPENFLWGSATAGHQIEGNNIHAQRYVQELAHPEKFEQPSGRACNSYELYKEDIALLKELKHQAYRFSIEWSRIEPAEGEFCKEALEHYLNELRLLREAGISSCVTLHHFTHPEWFEEKGGFSKEENLKYWEKYLSFLLPKIAPLVDSWCVLNEFNLGGDSDLAGKKNKLKAHGRGYHLIKAYSSAPVSSAHAFIHRDPKRKYDRMDNALASYLDWTDNEFFFHAIRTGEIVLPFMEMEYVKELKSACDFWAVNFYTRAITDARSASGRGRAWDFNRYNMIDSCFYKEEFTPESLIHNLSRLQDKPVWITENGTCADDDRFRILSLAMHLSALAEGAKLYHLDIRSYFYWSLLDNYEWTSFRPRFGLVHVDFDSFRRTPKKSAYFYREIIENNGLTGSLVEKYLPELPKLALYNESVPK